MFQRYMREVVGTTENCRSAGSPLLGESNFSESESETGFNDLLRGERT